MAVNFVLMTTVAGTMMASATFSSMDSCMEMRNKVVESQPAVTAVCVPQDAKVKRERKGPPEMFEKMFSMMQMFMQRAMEHEEKRLDMIEDNIDSLREEQYMCHGSLRYEDCYSDLGPLHGNKKDF